MNKKEFNERVARLAEVGNAIKDLPSEVRAEAFKLVKDFVTGGGSSGGKATEPVGLSAEKGDEEAITDKAAFFEKFSQEKPADNVKCLAAFLFQERGSEAFKTDELVALAEDVGLTIPARADMTLEQALSDGKHLFTRSGRGQFKPTVHGEAYFRKQYNAKKGRKKAASE